MKTILHIMRHSRFFLRFFKSVIIILILVTIIYSWFFYTSFVLKQKNEIIDNVYESLNNFEKAINSKLDELLRIVIDINRNDEFFYNMFSSNKQREQMIKELERYTISNGFIEDISYYSLLDKNTVYSNLGIYTNELFSKYIYNTDNINREDFMKRKKLLTMATIPSYSLKKSLSISPVIAFVYGLPIGTENQKRFVTYYVNKNQINEIIKDTLGSLPIELYIYEMDTLIFSTEEIYFPEDTESNYFIELAANSNKRPVKKGDGVYFSLNSKYNTWTYVLKCNNNVLFSEFYMTRIFYIILLCIILLLMLFTASIIALFNYQPVYKLVSNFKKQNLVLHDQFYFDEIAYINKLVETEINKKQRLLRNLFVSNLIWGQYENTESIYMAAQEANIVFEFKYFTCCTVFFRSNNENSSPKEEVLLSIVENNLDLPNTQAICAKLHNQPYISVVLNHYDDELIINNLWSDLEHLIKDAEEACNCILAIGISENCASVEEIPQIYEQSRQFAYYCLLNNKKIATFEHNNIIENSKQFTDLKLNISNDINRGNHKAAMSKIDQFIIQWSSEYGNIVTRHYLSYQILDYIVNTLSPTFQNIESKCIKDYKQILLNPEELKYFMKAL